MKSEKKRLLFGIIQLILAVLILLNVTIMYLTYSKGEEALEKLPFAILEVSGVSMEPKLSQGDGVLVYEADYENLKVGDVIVFYQDGQLITHEIIKIQDTEITTQGTANQVEDSSITKEEYRAKMIFKIPYLSVILMFYSSPIYMTLFALGLFFLIFGYKIFNNLYDFIQKKKQTKYRYK